jgi:molybdopterin converting factor small subunit
MPEIVVPGSWHNVTGGQSRLTLSGRNLAEVVDSFVQAYPDAAYRLRSSKRELLTHHMFFVDGEQILRSTSPDDVELAPASVVEIIPPLAGG